MNVYVFQAELLCESCGDAIKARLDTPPGFDPDDEASYDSDVYPKGSYPDGGGEADHPCHCGNCGVFLKNALTGDGEQYVIEAVKSGKGNLAALEEWQSYYDYLDFD